MHEDVVTPEAKLAGPADGEIRKFVFDFSEAIRSKDVDAIMDCYAPDLQSFDMLPPLQYSYGDYRRNWEMVQQVEGRNGFDVDRLNIHCEGNLAFVHALIHMHGKMKNSETMDVWSRWTAGLVRREGKWQIVHDHHSVPIDMESQKGQFHLGPQKH